MATAPLGTLLRHIHKLAGEPPGLPRRTDRQLLDDFAGRRSEAAFTALVSRHGPMVLRVCRRVLRHEQDAEDAFQATFVVLARNTRSIHKREALASWLHGVAYRTAMKAKRSAARRRNHEARAQTLAPPPAPGPTWDEVRAVLDEEVQRLAPCFRAAFVLCVLEGKSGPEAAAELGCKEGTVKSRVNRARQELRRRLTRRGIDLGTLLAALSVGESATRAALPATLAGAAIRSGLLVAAGEPAAGLIPAHVAALAAGVTRAMFLTKAKIAAVAFLMVSLVAAGALTCQAPAAKEPPAKTKPQTPRAEAKPQAAADAKEEVGDTVEVTGRVLGPDGKPVVGARVRFVRLTLNRRDPPPAPPAPLATTGADGGFHFRVPRTGFRTEEEKTYWFTVTLTAVAAGYGPGWVTVSRPEQLRDLVVKLVKDDVPITGRILDLEGKPVRGVTVRVVSFGATREEDLKPWVEALQAKKEIYGPHYPRTNLGPAVVGLERPAVTGADGTFRLTGIGRERLVGLRFEGPTIETREVYALTRPGPTIQVPRQKDEPQFGSVVFHGAAFDHAAAPTRPIVGVVRDKDTGKPLAGVTIRARVPSALDGSGERVLRATSNQEGRYRLVGLGKSDGQSIYAVPAAEQPYLLSARTAGAASGLEPVTMDFSLKRGVRIHGKVIDKASGKPIPGVDVDYFAFVDNPHLREAPGFRGSGGVRARSGADGSFTLVGMPGRGLLAAKARDGAERRYLMAAGADEIEGSQRNQRFSFITDPYICDAPLFNTLVAINPAKDAAAITQNVALDPGKTVTGTVVDPDGKPVAGVSINGVWGVSLHIGHLPTAEFRVPAIDPKHPRPLFFRHHQKKLGTAVIFRGDEGKPVTVRLQKCATLTGRLVDEDGQPRAGVILTGDILKGQLNITEGWLGFIHGTTDRDGRFKIEGILPGVKVGLATQKGAALTGRVVPELTLQAGETKDLGDVQSKMENP